MKLIYSLFLLIILTSCPKSKVTESESLGVAKTNKSLVVTDDKICITPWGEQLLNGEKRVGYKKNKTADCKESCESASAVLLCKDGVLSNSDVYLYNICEKPKCDCNVDLFSPSVVLKHGDYIKLFTKSSSDCQACSLFEVQRQCLDGILSGDLNAKYQNCATNSCHDCALSTTETLKHGDTRDFFNSATGLSCDFSANCASVNLKQPRQCLNGVLTGNTTFNKLTCTNTFCSCKVQTTSFNHLASVTYYKNAAPKCSDGYTCESATNKVTSTCSDGTITGLGGATPYGSCTNPDCSCIYTDTAGVKTTLTDGQTLPVYSKSTVACGILCDTVKGSVTCTKGVLTGNTTYLAKTCGVSDCGCKHAGRSFNNGSSLQVYSNATPNCGTTCPSFAGSVTCTNNVVSGDITFTNATCAEKTCNCSYTNIDSGITTILNTKSADVYPVKSVVCGAACVKGSVSCNSTVLSGDTTYKAPSCAEQQCICTTPWGSNVLAAETKLSSNKISFFKQDKSICGQLKCSLIANNSEDYYCIKNAGNTYWVNSLDQKITAFPEYKYANCQDPTCFCDVYGKQIAQDVVGNFYKKNAVACGVACETVDNYISIKCNANLTKTVTPAATNLEVFFSSTVYTSCEVGACPPGETTTTPGVNNGSGDGKAGDGGGAGGGTGDGEGPGIGFKGRGGGGGAGGPPSNGITFGGIHKSVQPYGCTLPWGGVVTQGSSINAYTQANAPSGHKCSEYRAFRMCIAGLLTGNILATNLECAEML